jgi:hypothetical protein
MAVGAFEVCYSAIVKHKLFNKQDKFLNDIAERFFNISRMLHSVEYGQDINIHVFNSEFKLRQKSW